MARMNGAETIAASATSKSRSVRTTIPAFVARQIGIGEGDRLCWSLDKDGKTWCAVIRKK